MCYVVVVLIFVGNDEFVGNLIVEIVEKIGFDGVIFIELFFILEIFVIVEEGMKVSIKNFIFILR